MQADFAKMHGLGNDFVVFDARAGGLGLSAARVAAIADRRTGVGCDQLIVLEAAEGADAFMRIRNPDGSEAGACGNATRCVASLLHAQTGRRQAVIRTLAGDLASEVLGDGRVRVDMGAPRFEAGAVPVLAADTLHVALGRHDAACCSMGNPHATVFVDDVAAEDVAGQGARFEVDALFPERANIGFAQVLAPDRIRLRVWERGAGLTLACGSGACAALVNAHRRGFLGREAEVLLDGGSLSVAWGADDRVLMTGPVAFAFSGRLDLAAFPA